MKAWLSDIRLFPDSYSFILHPSSFILPCAFPFPHADLLAWPRRTNDCEGERLLERAEGRFTRGGRFRGGGRGRARVRAGERDEGAFGGEQGLPGGDAARAL